MAKSKDKRGNRLAEEHSPYLQQHAQNPVHWVPWAEQYLKQAKTEDRLMIISIGYAACHWCHVMEHESFEDLEVAQLMNAHFINIKIDREERPDVDHVYMQALQLLTGRGGWPLNIITLPDGRPIWGGTYFPKTQWMDYLNQIVQLKKENPNKLFTYAQQLEQGIKSIELEKQQGSYLPLDQNQIESAIQKMQQLFDTQNGGLSGAPKFMMPSLIALFLEHKSTVAHAHLSLKKMALGGVFDVIGGGFSRYAVDEKWHIPHFEKMGYDNGQLLSIYALAYRQKQDPLYREVVDKTIDFLTQKLMDKSGGFFAALDADSLDDNQTLKEGAFYSWTKAELDEMNLKRQDLFNAYLGINQDGYWEEGYYVPYRLLSRHEFIEKYGLGADFHSTIDQWEDTLKSVRNMRPKPRLDNKIICSWNALIGQGLLNAFRVFKKNNYRTLVEKHIAFTETTFFDNTGAILRLNRKGKHLINGFFEDYTSLIAYFILAYETFFKERYLELVDVLIEYCFQNFLSSQGPLFFFSAAKELLVQTKEINDNVIPSSNAVMVENLLKAGVYLGKSHWVEHAHRMLETVGEEVIKYPRAHSNWLRIAIHQNKPQREIVVVGPKAFDWIGKLQQFFLEESLWAASEKRSKLPLLNHRYKDGKTLIYCCENGQCQLPYNDLEQAMEAMSIMPF